MDNLIIVTDCGCDEHPACQATFSGNKAALVKILLNGLSMCGEYYTHTCEFGFTHRVMVHPPPPASISSDLRLCGTQ